MFRLARPLAVLFLIVNALIAALWLTLLHPASPDIVSRAAGVTSSSTAPASPAAPMTRSMPVGLMLPPPDCVPQQTSAQVQPPVGRRIAQLGAVPANLSESITAVFPPCGSAHPSHVPQQAPDLAGVSFQILGVIRYQGSAGTVVVETNRPSAAAISQGLDLGSRAGTLPDGSTFDTMENVSTTLANQVQWFKDGLIITIASDLPLDQLEALAATTTVK